MQNVNIKTQNYNSKFKMKINAQPENVINNFAFYAVILHFDF